MTDEEAAKLVGRLSAVIPTINPEFRQWAMGQFLAWPVLPVAQAINDMPGLCGRFIDAAALLQRIRHYGRDPAEHLARREAEIARAQRRREAIQAERNAIATFWAEVDTAMARLDPAVIEQLKADVMTSLSLTDESRQRLTRKDPRTNRVLKALIAERIGIRRGIGKVA